MHHACVTFKHENMKHLFWTLHLLVHRNSKQSIRCRNAHHILTKWMTNRTNLMFDTRRIKIKRHSLRNVIAINLLSWVKIWAPQFTSKNFNIYITKLKQCFTICTCIMLCAPKHLVSLKLSWISPPLTFKYYRLGLV